MTPVGRRGRSSPNSRCGPASGWTPSYLALQASAPLHAPVGFPAFIFTIVLLVLVLIPGIGKVANGSRGWSAIGGFSMQPSELAKIAFAIWEHICSRRGASEQATLREMVIPLVRPPLVCRHSIVLQPDLGQTVTLSIILLGLLYTWSAAAGVRQLARGDGGRGRRARGVGGLPFRSRAVLAQPGADPGGAGYQARQARFALANGGVFGNWTRPGQRPSDNHSPNAHNDFIFAIIGEENPRYVGAAGLLVALRSVRLHRHVRIARRSADPHPAPAGRPPSRQG